MKKVCVIRNAEVESNASMLRVISALNELPETEIIVNSRSRSSESQDKVRRKKLIRDGQIIENHELVIDSKYASGIKNIFSLINYQLTLFKWLRKNRNSYNIIHAVDMDAGLPSLLATILFKKQLVYHIADYYADSRAGIPKLLYKLISGLENTIINHADVTIICTEQRVEQIKNANPKKVEVIHNTPIIEKSHDSINNNDQFTVTYVGSLSETRFINEILEIAEELPHIKFVLAGYGKVENNVQEYSLRNQNIEFLGRVSYDEALFLYQNTDLMFAMYNPSVANHKYSAPNKVYEAMAFGKPILVAENTGIDQLVNGNNIGEVIPYSKEAFKETLVKLASNKEYYDMLSKNSALSYEKYSWETMKSKLKNIYKNL